ncbi:MAG TPA: HAD-IA family hydrolase [Patescibacteria group bacterium]
MISSLLFDLSRVIIFPKNIAYSADIHFLYQQLLKKNSLFDFDSYFYFNDELLSYISAQKSLYSMFIFTSGDMYLHPKVEKKLAPFFERIISTRDFGLEKDDPTVYQLALGKVKKTAAETVYIDDEQTHIFAAKLAGITTIHYSSNQHLYEELDRLNTF